MKYFFDCEFIERANTRSAPATIQLISIGMVDEDGNTFYAENTDFDPLLLNDWVTKNVVPSLRWWGKSSTSDRFVANTANEHAWDTEVWGSPQKIANELLTFAPPPLEPEFWGWYSAYDWVVFCWLFGTMMELPEGYPKYCRDLKHIADMFGIRSNVKEPKNEHNALDDAQYHKRLYDDIKDQVGVINTNTKVLSL